MSLARDLFPGHDPLAAGGPVAAGAPGGTTAFSLAGEPGEPGDEPTGVADAPDEDALERQNASLRLGLMERCGVGPPGRLLDVGCGRGEFLDEARWRGWKVEGIEASPAPARIARRRHDLYVRTDLAEAAPGAFDVVTVFRVLEHAPRPHGLLSLARRCLRPGGVLILETRDRASLFARAMGRRWQDLVAPAPIWLFDRESLGLVLRRVGLRPERIERAGTFVRLSATAPLSARLPVSLRAIAAALFGGRVVPARALRDRFGGLVTIIARRDA